MVSQTNILVTSWCGLPSASVKASLRLMWEIDPAMKINQKLDI